MEGGLGLFLTHPTIQVEYVDLYRIDGVHLSNKGNNIFLSDIHQGSILP